MTDVNEVLKERGARYGDYGEQALLVTNITNLLKGEMDVNDQFNALNVKEVAVVEQTLFMLATKMARIVQGDPLYLDNWIDIEGYSKRAGQVLGGTE